MKNKNLKNRTVIREERISGKFTTVPHRIINDKRLGSSARLLLISTLSDSDNFDFSRTGLQNSLGFGETKLETAIKELIQYGYLKKTKTFGQYFHYTISEYGNLNKELKVSQGSENDNLIAVNTENDTDYLNSEQYINDLEGLEKYILEKQEYLNHQLLSEDIKEINCRNDIFKIKSVQDKEVKKNKAKHFKELENFVNSKPSFKEYRTKILNEIKRLITDEHKKLSQRDVLRIKAKISHERYKKKVKKYGFDLETQMVDRYENPLD